MKPRIRRSYVWALLTASAVVLWIASGSIPGPFGERDGAATGAPEAASTDAAASAPAFRVQVVRFTAQDMPASLRATGRSEAVRRVEVRARTAGIVEEVPVDKGERVGEGALLCRLDRGAREAKLAEERARMASSQVEFQAAEKLAQQQFASETRLALAQAELDAARASLESMQREITYTEIISPIDGVVERREAEIGSFLLVGGACATVMDLDPLLVVVDVAERDIARLETGMHAQAEFVTGEAVEGSVSFIAPAADEDTRTFRVEVEIANPALTLRDGVTAEVVVALPSRKAHLLPASALSLSDNGEIGVHLIEAADKVRFAPVTVLSDRRDGVWVSGLPETADIITVGQDYVSDGQTVDPVFPDAETPR